MENPIKIANTNRKFNSIQKLIENAHKRDIIKIKIEETNKGLLLPYLSAI